MPTLERAIEIAVQAHTGQKDKGGELYILHPLRLMLKMDTNSERLVAVLHDVIEDSDWTLKHLLDEDFPEPVVIALDHLTRRKNEPYEDFIDRVSVNALARIVKIADLKDNLDASRIPRLTDEDAVRIRKYQQALAVLTSFGTTSSAGGK